MEYFRSTIIPTSSLSKEEEIKCKIEAKEKLKEEMKEEVISLVEANCTFFEDFDPIYGNTKILCVLNL